MAVTSKSFMDDPSIITMRVVGSRNCCTRDSKNAAFEKFKDASILKMRIPENMSKVKIFFSFSVLPGVVTR